MIVLPRLELVEGAGIGEGDFLVEGVGELAGELESIRWFCLSDS